MLTRMLTASALGLAAPASAGNLTVGAGSTLDLGTGSLALGCADLDVAGTLIAGSSGFSAGRDITIAPTGTLNGNSAVLSLSGDWDNAGTFNAGTSSVQIVDGCALLSGTVVGNSTFANLSFSSASARLQRFSTGSTQTVTGLFSLLGASGNRLQVRSTLAGSAAFLNVTGSSSVSHVDVDDSDALLGNAISLPTNSVKGLNTPGWLQEIVVPLLAPLGLAALALLLLVSGRRWLPRSTRADPSL
jgi:hypothetical protein